MKNLLITALVLASMSLSAQKMDFWLDAGLKVQSGFSSLYNANAAEGEWANAIAKSTKFGVKLGINFNYTGVSIDIMQGKQNGKFMNQTGNFDRELSINTTDIYVLFRNAKNKGYIELGPKMSFIGDVRVTDDNTPSNQPQDPYYETNNLGAVLGFGTYVLGPEDGRFSGIFGLRFEYGFQDVTNDAGKVAGENRQPVNYLGDSSSTHPIFAGIVFELNWGIGGVGQARCGERSKFIWF